MHAHFYFALTFFVTCAKTQFISNRFQPSVRIKEDNVDDKIIEAFNDCKCVIFYLCDELNYIIPPENLKNTKVPTNTALRRVRRLTCSNNNYFCCKDRDSSSLNTNSHLSPTTAQHTTPPTRIPHPTSKVHAFAYPRPHANVLPSSTTCGRGNPPYSTTNEEFPWTVSIFTKRRKANNYSFKCGGSLIHPNVVLTAQHCVRSARKVSLRVAIGADNPNSANVKSVSKIIKHDQYYSGGMYNDIALLILEEPFSVNPVCLTRSNHFDGSRCFVAKWTQDEGMKKELKKIELPMVNFQRCENLLRRTNLGEEFALHSSFLCAGGEEGVDTCRWDGGMPLMCVENNRYVQVGITSWGVGCGQKDVPGVYTNVSEFKDWIDEELRRGVR